MAKHKFHFGLLPTNFYHQAGQFFQYSTLHGVRYIAERRRSFGERFLWFCSISVGAVAVFVIIGSLWEKFQTNPTITGNYYRLCAETLICCHFSTLTGLDTDIHNDVLEFPTVTVCPIDPTDEEKINATANDFFETDVDKSYDYVDLLPFYRIFAGLSYDNLLAADLEYQKALKIDPNIKQSLREVSLREMAFKLALRCDDFFTDCTYRGSPIPCCEYFENLYSERGFCFSFNPRYIATPNKEWDFVSLGTFSVINCRHFSKPSLNF